jgi:protoporphyrinogen oxidase
MALALSISATLSFDDLTSAPRLAQRSAVDTFSDEAAHYLICPPYEILMGYRPDDVSLALPVAALRHRSPPVTLPGGFAQLPAALGRLCDIVYGVKVTAIHRTSTGVILSATTDDSRRTYEAAAVIVATDAIDAAAILGVACPWYAFLRSVPYSRADWVFVRTGSALAPPTPSGIPLTFQLIPPQARAPAALLGFIGFENHRVSTGGLLLLAAGAGTGTDTLTDDELTTMLLRDAERYHPGLVGDVVARRVVRWEHFVPVFSPAHIARVVALRPSLTPGPIDVAGDYLTAPWMEGAVRAGEEAATRTHDFLTTRPACGPR